MLLSYRARLSLDALHRRKTAAYGNAWKKRGEVLGVLCNIARKVDRIEHLNRGGTATRDETLVDTCIDLLVYCIKYQLFLVDLQPSLADALSLIERVPSNFSDDLDGFTLALATIDLTPLDRLDNVSPAALLEVTTSFAQLEESFVGLTAVSTAAERLDRARLLAERAVCALAAAATADFVGFSAFLEESYG